MSQFPFPSHHVPFTDLESFDSHTNALANTQSSSMPATPDLDATILSTEPSLRHATTQPPINDLSSLLGTSAPFPLPPTLPLPLETPVRDEVEPQLDLSLGLSTRNTSLPTPTVHRIAHNLRLPSFDVLGIAAPHPDDISMRTASSFSLGAGPLSKPEDPLHVLSPPLSLHPRADRLEETPTLNATSTTTHLEHLITTVTPPSDLGNFSWGSFVNVRTAGLGSPPNSDPGLGSPPNSDPGLTPNVNLTASAAPPGQAPIIVPTYAELSHAVGMAAWVEEVKNTIINESKCLDLVSVKILSHALPCPSLLGHLFGQIIAAIHDRTGTRTSWINVFHAVPGRYTLADLPKSPPATPGPAVGGDSYFTSKVFDSAVAIPNYQLDSKLLPPSPQPVVPPGSMNVSVVERYIPPTNTNEYAEMFSFGGRSLLHDRLIELSANRGVMLFVYPTRTGAQTFMQQYLGPILDPLLRTITVTHDLHSELGKNLGEMAAVNYLEEFDQLSFQIQKFCDALGIRSDGNIEQVTYKIVYAVKKQVVLDRSAWADDWWVKQEKSRIRDEVTKYFRKSKKLPADDITGVHLIQEVLDGVSKREYRNKGPETGVEVGVFIIKKIRVM